MTRVMRNSAAGIPKTNLTACSLGEVVAGFFDGVLTAIGSVDSELMIVTDPVWRAMATSSTPETD